MKKLLLLIAILFFQTASAQRFEEDEYTIRNIDGREYKVARLNGPIIYFLRTSTWEAETTKAHLNGEDFSASERNARLMLKITPPSNFDSRMTKLYEQVFSINEREAIKWAYFYVWLYLDVNTGKVTGVEFEIDTDSKQGFAHVPLEKWAKFDKLIMDADFTFTIPAMRQDANYETALWARKEDGNVTRETSYLYCDIIPVASEAEINRDGVFMLPASATVNGNPELYDEDPVTFVINSKTKGFKIYLRQCNYDLDKLAQVRYTTTRDAKKFNSGKLSSSMYSYYKKLDNNAGAILKMTKEQACAWAESMKEKNVVLINNVFNSSSGIGNDGGHQTWQIRDVWCNKPI